MNFLYFNTSYIADDPVHSILNHIGNVKVIQNFIEGEPLRSSINKYDAIIVRSFSELFNHKILTNHKNIIVVPDLHEQTETNAKFVLKCSNIKLLCLSRQIYSFFKQFTKGCFYIQYYPKPKLVKSNAVNTNVDVIIDDSSTSFSIPQIAYLFKNSNVNRYFFNEANNIEVIEDFSKLYNIQIKNSDHINFFYEDVGKQFIYVVSKKSTFFDFDFLNLMNQGICVVAPNVAPFNEYITDGTTGYLYNLNNVYPLNIENSNKIADKGKESIINGYDRLNNNYNQLKYFISMDQEKNDEFSISSIWEHPKQEHTIVAEEKCLSKVSVVTVCRNAATEIEHTIKSVLKQDYPNLEYVILDGASSDGTVELIEKYDSFIDYWHTKSDLGIYSTMIESLNYLNGDYVIFMNAGDSFVGHDAISRMFKDVPNGISLIYGHHIYVKDDGIDEFHTAADFDTTWYRLKNGYLDYDWLSGIPCHQSVATKVDVLKNFKFDERYKIAADHEFYFKIRQAGHLFYNSNELISVYVGGGVSSKKVIECIEEWKIIAKTYGNKASSEIFYNKFLPISPTNLKLYNKILSLLKKGTHSSKLLTKMLNLCESRFFAHKDVEYWAELEDGITMFRQGRPSFIKTMSGFGEVESWGRWTTQKKSIIKFKHTLPLNFELILRGYAFGKNVGKPIKLKVGKKKYRFSMDGLPCKEYKIIVNNADHSNVLEISSAFADSPYHLFNKQSHDKRRLGIAISEIIINERG